MAPRVTAVVQCITLLSCPIIAGRRIGDYRFSKIPRTTNNNKQIGGEHSSRIHGSRTYLRTHSQRTYQLPDKSFIDLCSRATNQRSHGFIRI